MSLIEICLDCQDHEVCPEHGIVHVGSSRRIWLCKLRRHKVYKVFGCGSSSSSQKANGEER